MLRFLCLIALCELSAASPKLRNREGAYKVYRIVPRTAAHMAALQRIRDIAVDYELDIWKESSNPGDFCDLMVPPYAQSKLEEFFVAQQLPFTVTVPDVQKLIERNEVDSSSMFRLERRPSKYGGVPRPFTPLKDDPILDSLADNSVESQSRIGQLKAKYRFGDYGSYKEMIKYMRTIEFYYPNITKLIRIGKTHRGIPIEGLKIGYPLNDLRKRGFWIDGNIHAREWASSHTALYFINQLVSGYGTNSNVTRYVNSLNFYIFPCLNPDGYEYTRSQPHPQVRLWRKNRSNQKCVKSLWGGQRCCEGVDLNRNFDFHWSETGSSSNPCSNLYQGDTVFSEPETRAVRDFLLSPEVRGKVDGFVTLHTYAQLWIHPYSHELATYPVDFVELKRTAKRAIDRLKGVYGTQYRIGTGADTLSAASGGSDDWAKGVLGVKYVYLVELRPQLELSNGFILSKHELIPTAVETWEALQEVIESAIRDVRPLRVVTSAEIPLSSQLMRKQLFRQRALNEDSVLRQQRGEQFARRPDGDLRHRTLNAFSSSQLANTEHHQTSTNGETNGFTQAITFAHSHKNDEPSRQRSGALVSSTAEDGGFRNVAWPLASSHPPAGDFTGSLSDGLPMLLVPSTNTTPFPWSVSPAPHGPAASATNPACKDLLFSCPFWLSSDKSVCQGQREFMHLHCPYTCHFCA